MYIIRIPVKTHHCFIIKVHESCHIIYNRIQLCFWSKQPQIYSILLQNMGWLGRIWQGWTENMALITLPVFMYLSDELVMTFYWDMCSLQPYIIPIQVNTALTHSSLLQNIGWAGRTWWGWTSNLSLISLPGFMHFSDELWWQFIGIHII